MKLNDLLTELTAAGGVYGVNQNLFSEPVKRPTSFKIRPYGAVKKKKKKVRRKKSKKISDSPDAPFEKP